MEIQKLRLKHGWSQQQLADISGLNVRTIQRLEAGKSASLESLKSLAAVFQVDVATLTEGNSMHNGVTDTVAPKAAEDDVEQAFQHVRKVRRFYLFALAYGLMVLAVGVSYGLFGYHRPWVWWVMAGWGMALCIRAARLFWLDGIWGVKWERRMVEKRLGRPL